MTTDPSRATPAAPAGGAKPSDPFPKSVALPHGGKLHRADLGPGRQSDMRYYHARLTLEQVRGLAAPQPTPDPAPGRTVAPDLGGSSGGTGGAGLHQPAIDSAKLAYDHANAPPWISERNVRTIVGAYLAHMADAPAAPAAGGAAGVPTVEVMAERIRHSLAGRPTASLLYDDALREAVAYALTGLPPGPDRDAALARLAEPRAGAGGPSRDAGRVDAGAVQTYAAKRANLNAAIDAVWDPEGGKAHPCTQSLAEAQIDEEDAWRAVETALAAAGGDGSAGEGWRDISTAPQTVDDILILVEREVPCYWDEEAGKMIDTQGPSIRFVTISSFEDLPYRRGFRHRNGAWGAIAWMPLPGLGTIGAPLVFAAQPETAK